MKKFIVFLMALLFSGSAFAETRYFLIRTDADLANSGLSNEKGMAIGQAGSATTIEAADTGKCSKKSDSYGGETNELSTSAFYAGNAFNEAIVMFVHATNGKPVRIPGSLIRGDKPANGKKFSSWTQLDYDGSTGNYRSCIQDGVSYYKYSATMD